MLTVSIGLRCLLAVILFIGLFYIIGQSIFRLTSNTKNGKTHTFFESIVIGLLMVISCYAIFVTDGKSLLLPIPFLILALAFTENDKKDNGGFIAAKTIVWFSVLCFVLFFSYYLQAFISLDSESFRFASLDHSYYARLASTINRYAIESPNLFYPGIDNYKPEPYHYMDIWTTAFVSRFTGLNSHYSLSIVVYPLFASIFSVGMFEAAVKRYGNSLKVKLISIFSLFFSGLGFFFPTFLLKAEVYDYAPVVYTKALFPAIIILWALYYYNKRSFNKLFMASICGALAFITIAPSFGMVLFLLFVYLVFIKKNKLFTFWPSVTALLVTVFYVGYLYKSGSGKVNIIDETILSYLRRLAAILFGGGLQFFVWIPLLLLLFINRQKVVSGNFISGVFLLICLAFTGLFAWSVFWPFTIEAVQFFSIIFIPVSAILTGKVLLFVTDRPNMITLFLVLGLSGYLVSKSIHYNFDVESVNTKDVQALKLFSNNFSGRFANYKNPGEFTNIFQAHTLIFPPMLWIEYYNEQYQNYSLNSMEILRDSTTFEGKSGKKFVQLSPYYQFAQKNMRQSPDDSRIAFLKSYDINYVMVSPKSKLGAGFNLIISDSLVLSDGWRVYKINLSTDRGL